MDPTKELINLIRTQRLFEMNSQSIQAADELLAKWQTSAVVDAFVLVAALASSRVTLQHEVWLEGDAPLTLGDLAKLEGEACRYHALEVPLEAARRCRRSRLRDPLLDHCAAPVFRWEFRGSVATIERTSLPSIEDPASTAAPNPGPQSLRAIIAKRLRLAPDQLRVHSLDGTELPEKVIGPYGPTRPFEGCEPGLARPTMPSLWRLLTKTVNGIPIGSSIRGPR